MNTPQDPAQEHTPAQTPAPISAPSCEHGTQCSAGVSACAAPAHKSSTVLTFEFRHRLGAFQTVSNVFNLFCRNPIYKPSENSPDSPSFPPQSHRPVSSKPAGAAHHSQFYPILHPLKVPGKSRADRSPAFPAPFSRAFESLLQFPEPCSFLLAGMSERCGA